jgi:exosortase
MAFRGRRVSGRRMPPGGRVSCKNEGIDAESLPAHRSQTILARPPERFGRREGVLAQDHPAVKLPSESDTLQSASTPERPAVNTPVTVLPANRPRLLPPTSTAPPGGPDLRRTFPEDCSLWESVRLRGLALIEDLRQPEQSGPLRLVAVLAGLLVFSYWPGLLNAKASWNNPQYSHGWIVPLFSVAILFWWRQPITPVAVSARLAGLGLLVASLALRLLVARYRIITIDMYTFVPALAGVVLMGGGWSMFRWAWPPIGFLIFMYPLPDEATRYLLGPLQTMATMVSTYAIQTLGVDAIREGNQIVVGERHLGVVDACSGLRMLTIFIALSVAIVMLGNLEWYESLVIMGSAIPIALIVNAIRITLTGVMYTINPDIAEKIFHDWAGYFMMPMALGLLYLVQTLLSVLFVVDDTQLATVGPLQGVAGPLQGMAAKGLRAGGLAGPGGLNLQVGVSGNGAAVQARRPGAAEADVLTERKQADLGTSDSG